ncbi:MAG: hypothetical protein N2C14_02660, partial [Planctomycetales bacterium]
MRVRTGEMFLAKLEESRLFSPEQLDNLRSSTNEATTPEKIATELLRREWLTRWQTRRLLEGETKFFLIGDKYRLLEIVGEGGMGEVYRAENTRTGQIVALKVLSPEAVDNPEAKARFQREIRAIS